MDLVQETRAGGLATPAVRGDGPGDTAGPAVESKESSPSLSLSESASDGLAISADDVAAEGIEEKELREYNNNGVGGPGPEEPNTLTREDTSAEPRYSVFSGAEKKGIVFAVAFIGIISPLTGAIYLPALNSLADDLDVEVSLINLSITTYQIFQGIAPSFIASVAENRGRRPAYMVALIIYLVANLALALQHNYAALMVLRCLQSAGSSAAVALGNAVVADMVTRAERGSYMGWTSLGMSLGPALGPTVGGLLNGYLGWRAIFWFLLILTGVLLVILFCFLPETCRAVVGNGSVRPPRWNWTLKQRLSARKEAIKPSGKPMWLDERSTISKPRKRPNPFSAMKILMEPEGGVTLFMGAILFSGYFMVMTTLSEELTDRFGFDSVKTGLCYLPIGFGSLFSRFTAGQLFDWNFKRHARKLDVALDKKRQQSLDVFPIERIRLEVCIPMVYISCGTVLGYAWAMETQASLAGIEVSLFFLGLFFSGALQGLNTLIVDTHQDTPATATAANNLFRCLISAGGTALAPNMIKAIGIGYMGVFISGVWLVLSPLLWLVMIRGAKWRAADKAKREKKEAEKEQGAAGQTV